MEGRTWGREGDVGGGEEVAGERDRKREGGGRHEAGEAGKGREREKLLFSSCKATFLSE